MSQALRQTDEVARPGLIADLPSTRSGATPLIRTAIRAPAVKSPERSECARQTCAPMLPKEALAVAWCTPFSRSLTNAKPTSSQPVAAVKSGLGRAPTTSNACQSGEAEHPITHALRDAIPFVQDPRLSAGDDRRAFQDRPLRNDASVQIAPEIND